MQIFGINYVAPRFKSRGNDQPVINRILVALGNLQGSIVRLDRNGPRLWTEDAQERRERSEPPSSSCSVYAAPLQRTRLEPERIALRPQPGDWPFDDGSCPDETPSG